MVQIICGDKGKGKTTYLLEKANTSVKEAEGSVVYLDKNSKHMLELKNKIRLIDVSQFPVTGTEGFIGFISGIISQDRDLEFLFLDSFLKLGGLENGGSIEELITILEKLSNKYNFTIVISVSLDKANIPDSLHDKIIVAL